MAKGHEKHAEDGEEDESPLGPAPVFSDDDEGANDGARVSVSMFVVKEIHILEHSDFTYPSPGPKNGIKINTADAGPLTFAAYMSEIDPGATLSTGAQQKPAMKRIKQSAPKLCEKPAPTVNMAPSGTLAR